MAGAEASMAKSKGNTNTLYVGSTNVFGSATKVLNKKIGSVDGPKQITDDVTTDDSTGPEHDTIYPVIIESIEVEVLVDPADASYIFLNARSKDGVKCFVFWRPEGDVSTRDQFLFQATVHAKPKRDSDKWSRQTFTLKGSGAATPSAVP
jgi:hypothetical protein